MNNKPTLMNRSFTEWFLTLPVFSLLLLTLIIGTGEMFHGQLLRMGERLFGDPANNVQYFLLRGDPSLPDCNPSPDIDALVRAQMTVQSAPASGIDALFADEPKDENAIRASLVKGAELCKEKHDLYQRVVTHITPSVKAYRAFETSFFAIFKFGTENRSLILLLMVFICGTYATLSTHHIVLRPPRTVIDHRVQAMFMTVANGILALSSIMHLKIEMASGLEIEKPWIFYIWIVMFLTLALISLKQVIRQPTDAIPGGSLSGALLTVPLYSVMAIIGGIYFLGHRHWSGQAIYMNQMMELSSIFLNLALFIWSGMLLKQTRVVDMFMDILRPWKFSPETLTYLILLAAAVPTAYTGASGIFVIAAGAIVYHEVRASGGNRQFAIAATAMSGSLGVVLRPCLLVVLIAALNKQVTTSDLFHWGLYVFLLTSTLFFILSKLYGKPSGKLAPASEAIPGMMRALTPVAPYIVLVFLIVYAYQYLLDTKLNEFTAPVIMPVIMLFIVIFDKVRRIEPKNRPGHVPSPHAERRKSLEESVRFATNETIGHIGALIMLMCLSLTVGGLVERSGIMEAFPHHFANVYSAMTFLWIIKVILGMFMDPFGAVVLVSGTLAPIAYDNGIDPLHFWMMVLVAFELGYLLPPVALNQLLTRQVLGVEEMAIADEEVKNEPFMRRYERYILPVIVMTIGMLIVAYGPLIVVGK